MWNSRAPEKACEDMRHSRVDAIRLLCDIAEICQRDEGVRSLLRAALSRVCEFNGWCAGVAYLTDDTAPDGLRVAAEYFGRRWRTAHPEPSARDPLLSSAARRLAADMRRAPAPQWRALDAPLEGGPVDFVVTLPLNTDGTTTGVMQFFCIGAPECPEDIRLAVEAIGVQLGRVVERRHLQSAVMRATDRERLRIAQTLHDITCQELTGLALSTDRLVGALQRTDHPCAERAAQIRDGLRQSLRGVRDVLAGLAPPTIRKEGLAASLGLLADSVESMYQVRCICRCETEVYEPEAAVELFALASEAVSNAARHARAERIDIVLRVEGEALILEIIDDGVGLPAEPPRRGLGLSVMRCRAAALDGRLSINSQPGRGAAVRCEVPLHEGHASHTDPENPRDDEVMASHDRG